MRAFSSDRVGPVVVMVFGLFSIVYGVSAVVLSIHAGRSAATVTCLVSPGCLTEHEFAAGRTGRELVLRDGSASRCGGPQF